MPTTQLKECGFEYNNEENLYQVLLKGIKNLIESKTPPFKDKA